MLRSIHFNPLDALHIEYGQVQSNPAQRARYVPDGLGSDLRLSADLHKLSSSSQLTTASSLRFNVVAR